MSVWLSRQIRHWLSAVAAAVTAAVVAEAGFTEAEAVVSMVAVDTAAADIAAAADIMAAGDLVAADIMVVEDLVAAEVIVAAGMAARGLMVAEEVATPAAGLKLAAVRVCPEIGRRRTFALQSTMANGIRSATPVVQPVLRV